MDNTASCHLGYDHVRKLITEAKEAGLKFRLDYGRLVIDGPENGALEAKIKEHKDLIIDLMGGREMPVHVFLFYLRTYQVVLTEMWKILQGLIAHEADESTANNTHNKAVVSSWQEEFDALLIQWDIKCIALFSLPEYDGECPIGKNGCADESPIRCIACGEEQK